jgi:hypothetical protein
VVGSSPVEHPHRCLYCDTLWFCHEACVLAGPSVCAGCRERLLRSPETPLRVIPLRHPHVVIDRLAEHVAERLRDSLRRRRR